MQVAAVRHQMNLLVTATKDVEAPAFAAAEIPADVKRSAAIVKAVRIRTFQ
jgi:hypothetical protein